MVLDDERSPSGRPAGGNEGPGVVSASDSVPQAPAVYDADWHERIERAKRAREEGKKAREGKPATFPMNRALT